ncbi:MAG: hypothetical protein MRZ61_09710 [Oscillospiraceae bacterium]|nr:hypothetical protein [Oscillospiraceae bacterium]
MFNLGTFIKGGLVAAVGKMADYQIILNAAGWFEKGVLTETDLAEIQTAIDEKNARLEAERIAAEENITEDVAEVENEDTTDAYYSE